MNKINNKLIERFKSETGNCAIYTKNGITHHTLKYVNWLEHLLEHSDSGDGEATSKSCLNCRYWCREEFSPPCRNCHDDLDEWKPV